MSDSIFYVCSESWIASLHRFFALHLLKSGVHSLMVDVFSSTLAKSLISCCWESSMVAIYKQIIIIKLILAAQKANEHLYTLSLSTVISYYDTDDNILYQLYYIGQKVICFLILIVTCFHQKIVFNVGTHNVIIVIITCSCCTHSYSMTLYSQAN